MRGAGVPCEGGGVGESGGESATRKILIRDCPVLYFAYEENEFFQVPQGARDENGVPRPQGVWHDFNGTNSKTIVETLTRKTT